MARTPPGKTRQRILDFVPLHQFPGRLRWELAHPLDRRIRVLELVDRLQPAFVRIGRRGRFPISDQAGQEVVCEVGTPPPEELKVDPVERTVGPRAVRQIREVVHPV